MCAFWLNSRLIEILGRAGRRVRVADGQRADALRRGEIASSSSGDVVSDVGDVVEAEVAAVARQQRGDVDVERQQIANRVAVLGAVQPVHDVAARRALALPTRDRATSASHVGEAGVLGLASGAACPAAASRARSACAARAPTSPRRRQVVEAGRFEIHRIVGRLRRAAVVAADAVLLEPARDASPHRRLWPAGRCATAAALRPAGRAAAHGCGGARAARRAAPAARARAARGARPGQRDASTTFFIVGLVSAFFSSAFCCARGSGGGTRRRIVRAELHQLAHRGDHFLARVPLAAARRANRCCCPAAAAARASRPAAAASGCPC